MKYIVEVNAKFMVSIEANSCLDAEHKLLDYDGVWGAMAYDSKMMKTDTFAGAVQGCEMVSMNDIRRMSNAYSEALNRFSESTKQYTEANKEIERLTALLEQAKEKAREWDVTKANMSWVLQEEADAFGVRH